MLSAVTNIPGHSPELVALLMDAGSQTSFIEENMASHLRLATIESNINVTLRGFNEQKRFITRSVLLPLIINSKKYSISCLCIPEISVKFSTPHLKDLVELVTQNNQRLAYKPFYNSDQESVGNIKCILGSSDWDIVFDLPRKLIGDANNKQSACYLADDELIPIGSIERFLHNYKLEIKRNSIDLVCNVASMELDRIKQCSVTPLDSEPYCEEFDSSILMSQIEYEENEIDDILDIASYSELNETCNRLLHMDCVIQDENETFSEAEISNFMLDNSKVDESGRHEIAIPWLSRYKDKLNTNENLAHQVLKSIKKKYSKNSEILLKTDEIFKQQLSSNIIEQITNIEEYKALNKKHSFLPHFPLVRPERKSTKVRIIYLCNLAQKNSDGTMGISINKAVHPGYSKMHRIATAFAFTRFEKYLLSFDIVKCFHQLGISESNSAKFIFLWYKDVANGDFSLVYYRFKRVVFGLACAPFMLSICLHKILMTHQEQSQKNLNLLKKLIYHGSFVDNLFVGCSSLNELIYTQEQASLMFKDNKMPLQQWWTNHADFQKILNNLNNEPTDNVVKILGMQWDRISDKVVAPAYHMKESANTKRQILREIHKNYDLIGTKIPLLNRSRLFLRELQKDITLGWDTFIGVQRVNEWKNIVNQYNKYTSVAVPRCMGKRSDSYDLIVMTDASKNFIGAVIYLKNLSDGVISFLQAQNKLVDKILKSKTTPVLEFEAINFGVQKSLKLYEEFSTAVFPIHIASIKLFSDSSIALSWLAKAEYLETKIQTRSIYINNRIDTVVNECRRVHSISFTHIGTNLNSADFVTRSVSAKRLEKTEFISGPEMLKDDLEELDWLVVPNPNVKNDPMLPKFSVNIVNVNKSTSFSEVINICKMSSLKKAIKTLIFVQRFKNNLKHKLMQRNPMKYAHLRINREFESFAKCENLLLMEDQKKEFPEIFDYFKTKLKLRKTIPSLVAQMNIILDPKDGLLKVKSKMGKLLSNRISKFPILLNQKSTYGKLLVLDTHRKCNHSGIYYVLNQLRRKYFILKAFSSIKNVVKNCIHCRRFNARATKVNCNDYREFMVNTKQRLFSTMYIDYVGPFVCKVGKVKQKTYIVLFKCWWSKALNAVVVDSANAQGFIFAFQNHVYDYGIPEIVHSDSGTNFTAGFSWLRDTLDTVEVKDYLDELKVKAPTFEQFPRGSLNRGIPNFIESGVKIVKRLLQGAIRGNVLEILQFCSVVKQCICLANRRPLCNFSALRDQNVQSDYRIITPELLKFGYELAVLELNSSHDNDSWKPEELMDSNIAYKNLDHLLKVKGKIRELYHNEFLYGLLDNATKTKGRYLPVKHQVLAPGDTCLIKDPFVKQSCFPLGLIKKVTKNSLGEVTQAVVLKANKSLITRDSSDLVLLVRAENFDPDIAENENESPSGKKHSDEDSSSFINNLVDRRSAALNCNMALKEYFMDEG